MEYIDSLQSEAAPEPVMEVEETKVHPLLQAMQELKEEGIVESVDAHTIYSIVQSGHREPMDFIEGDIGDRIYWFDDYKKTSLPLSNLNLDEHYVDDDLVDDYVELIKSSPNTMPPIVFDPIANSIIDGIHRANAYAKLGYDAIPAYVGLTKSDTYGEREEVDEEIAYHGTTDDIAEFRPLTHFGTEKAAKDRMTYKKIKDGKIYKVDLDIKNPLTIKDFPGIHYDRLYAFELKDKRLISQEEMEDITFTQDPTELRKKLLAKLKELGIDGFVYKNRYEDKGNISYVIVDPSQVKVLSVEPATEEVTEANGNKVAYHVTPTQNLRSVMKNGLVPNIGDRSSKIAGEQSGIYLFPSVEAAEDAVMNWLGDEFDEDEPLTLLKVNIDGLEKYISQGADYELIVNTNIEPNRIKKLNTQLEEASPDTLEGSFTPDLVESKTWLAKMLAKGLKGKNAGTIYVLGSWYGNMGIFLQQAGVKFDKLVLVEPDEEALMRSKELLDTLNDEGKLILIHQNAEDVVYEKPGVVINTSCNETGPVFLTKLPDNMLCLFQARNNTNDVLIETESLGIFKDLFPLNKTYYSGQKELTDPETDYTRYMIIGRSGKKLDETSSTGQGGGSAGVGGGSMVGGPTTYEQEYGMFKSKGPRRIMAMTESTITLADIYDGAYPDQDEVIWNYVGDSDFDIPFEINTMQPFVLDQVLCQQYGVEDIEDLYDKMQPEQEEIIDHYKNDPNLSQKVIVLYQDRIIDGNHRAVAAVLANKPIKYIDVSEEEQ